MRAGVMQVARSAVGDAEVAPHHRAGLVDQPPIAEPRRRQQRRAMCDRSQSTMPRLEDVLLRTQGKDQLLVAGPTSTSR
jgi:hypothetical protein